MTSYDKCNILKIILMSRRRQYAYAPPRSAQAQTMSAPTLTHVQSGSTRHAQAREQAELAQEEDSQTMPPPPVPVNRVADLRFKKHSSTLQTDSSTTQPLSSRSSVIPPPTPQLSSSGSWDGLLQEEDQIIQPCCWICQIF